MKRTPLLFVLAATLLCCSAQAQWQWKDKAGNLVFSDRAPPSDIPARNILRQPSASARAAPPPAAAEAPSAAASAAAAEGDASAAIPKPGATDKELMERKKLADADAAAKTKAEDARRASIKAENCQRAIQAKTTIESGVRLRKTDAKGEREVLDDAGRAAEMRRVQAVIASDCR